MDTQQFQKLVEQRAKLDTEIYKALMEKAPAPAPIVAVAPPLPPPVVDVYQDALEKIRKGSPLLNAWRRQVTQYSARVAQVIADKLTALAAAGQAPAISFAEVNEALRKGTAISFTPDILNDFAGYSQGPGPTGAVVYKVWDKVTQQGPLQMQKATQSSTTFVQPAKIGGTDSDFELNVYSRESGLVAYHTGPDPTGGKQKLLFNFYPLGSARILWIGQPVDDSVQSLSKDTYTVAVNCRYQLGGQRAFLLILFELKIDPSGNVTLIDGPPPATFLADAPPYIAIRERLSHFKSIFTQWRTKFRDAGPNLGIAIAQAFEHEQEDKTRSAFTAAPLWGAELQHAFKDPSQPYSFQLSDLNQFAGRWKATIHAYPPGGQPAAILTQYLTWLEFTQGKDGFYQRVVGAAAPVEDPMCLSGDEQGLMSIVLDAYLPEYGLVSWAVFYNNPRAESPVMAYKLAGDRILWIAQFFDPKELDDAAKAKHPKLRQSEEFNLTLEWIVTDSGRKFRRLVSKTFTIDFTAGTLVPVESEPISKVESATV